MKGTEFHDLPKSEHTSDRAIEVRQPVRAPTRSRGRRRNLTRGEGKAGAWPMHPTASSHAPTT